MKKIKLIFIFTFFLSSCKPFDIDRVNNFYREKYPVLNKYKITINKEKSRKKILNKYFKDANFINKQIIVIEIFSYPNGNFDILNNETFIYVGGKIYRAYFLNFGDSNVVKDFTDKLSLNNKKTNELILELLDKGEFEKLSQLHKKVQYSVSDGGIIFVTFLDKNLNVLQGFMFNEFMVSDYYNLNK